MEWSGVCEAAMTRAIDKLASLMTKEANPLSRDQKAKVKILRSELQQLVAFLRDAEAKSEENERVKLWIQEVKELSEIIEDVVDHYVLKVSQPRFSSLLGQAGRLIGTLNSRRSLVSNIQNIKSLLVDLKEHCQLLDLRTGAFHRQTRAMDWIIGSENIVGIDSKVRELVRRLREGEPGRRSVISLVGVGGVGKTTLARKLYADEAVRGHFDCRAWISVDKSYKMEDVLRSLGQQIGLAGGEIMETGELMRSVHECLRSKQRYFLVFDDVWDKNFWRLVKDALPDGYGSGGRVIVTTRSDVVAACCSETRTDHIERVEPLSTEMSLELFRSRVFSPEFVQQIPEFENLYHRYVRLCKGLPLAINVVSGLLSMRDRTVQEWEKLLQNLHFELDPDSSLGFESKIVALSFRELSYHLKMCFLYFSIFPKDSLVSNDKLVKLWIAEDFVQEKDGMTLEQVAEEYLNELISRNMVQACEGFHGLEKYCRVHGLMRNMALQKADEFRFCHIQDDNNSNFSGKCRRLSISICATDNVFETDGGFRVRSVFLSNINALNKSFVVTLFEKYKLLTLLDFEYVQLDCLPNEVGTLFHLKYLSLKNTEVKKLPESVGKLLNLQTLDLRNTLIVELPIEIGKLQKLRHLLASGNENSNTLDSTKGVKVKEGIGALKQLQTLTTVEAHLSGMDVIQELKRLSQLRRLSVSRLTGELARALCACIEGMTHLESLSLYTMNDEILDLESISSAPPSLERLVLKGFLRSFPDWISSLSNLSVLCLSLSMFSDDPLRHLCHLPNLMSLWLYKAYDGEKLHFHGGDFPKLKLLVLREMERLETVEIEEGALPLLEELRIGPSKRLHEVPSGIKHLRNLKVVSFYDMPNEFVHEMQPDGGSEYQKVERIPSVLFWYRTQGRDYVSYRLGESDLLAHLQGLANDMGNVFQRDFRLSFCYGDDEEDNVAPFSFASNCWMSDDDIED